MSLPWFPFWIGDYIKNTMRLTTEGHGAYLLLILDYYAKEEAPPDDDEILASIAKLPVEVWQAKHRKVLAPFFKIMDGKWHHERIDDEIAEGHANLASSRLRASKGGQAYAAKMAARRAEALPKAGSKPTPSQESAPSHAASRLEADPRKASSPSPSPLDSLSTDRDAIREQVPDRGIGTEIDPLFSLGENQVATCKFDGATLEIIEAERLGFVAYHQERASVSNNWDASWVRWWKNWKEHRDKLAAQAERAAKPKAAPRIEVNTTIDWDNHCKFWTVARKWPRGIGPDPDSPACKCPKEILAKHNITVPA